MNEQENSFIPEHQSGTQTNTENVREFDTPALAKEFYQIVKKRLLDVNDWQSLAGRATAHFQVADENGKEADRPVQERDYLKIDIPGPGTASGEGYDWVMVEAIVARDTTDEEFTSITVRPATNPLNTKNDIAHLFSDEATSSFVVKREKNRVIAGVYGRNEKPNTDSETLTDSIRNTAMAAGALSGFSKIQWKSLVAGLLTEPAA